MNNLAELLEHELEDAVDIKNKKSLHRYILLLTENIVLKSGVENKLNDISSEIKVLTETMKLGFEAVDKRFEAVDKRFEAVDRRFEAVDKRFEDMYRNFDKRFEDMNKNMDKRFAMQQWMIGIGFTVLALLMSLYNFIK